MRSAQQHPAHTANRSFIGSNFGLFIYMGCKWRNSGVRFPSRRVYTRIAVTVHLDQFGARLSGAKGRPGAILSELGGSD